MLCLVSFLNRKEKTFSIQDHSHFYRTLTATSFSDERFHLNRVRKLRKRRNTKSNINGRVLRRRPKFLASILCTNGIITRKYKYLYQNVRLKKLNGQKIIDSYGLALGDGASWCRVVVVLSCLVLPALVCCRVLYILVIIYLR
jgi:hypothetical protein